MSGIAGIIVTLLAFLKLKTKTMLYYLIFILLLSILVVVNTFNFYISAVINYENTRLEIFIVIAFFLSFASIIFFSSEAIHAFLSKPYSITKRIIISILSGSSLFLIMIPLLIQTSALKIVDMLWFELYYFYSAFFFAYVAYFIVYCFLNLKSIKNNDYRNMLKTAIILLCIGFPGFIMDNFWEFFQVKLAIIPRRFNFTPTFYFFWNAFTVFFTIKYFFLNPVAEDISSLNLSQSFIQKFNLSEREIEIIKLAIQGLSNPEISEKIFISTGTVKNHIYHVYQKTGVNNKIELINLIRKSV